MSYQLNKKVIIKGKVVLLTGLHIGGTNASMGIGGVDKSVIRNPIDNKPIVPGSSLKGKMRSLLALSRGELGGSMGKKIQNGPTLNPDHLVARLFGTAISGKESEKQRPSRLIVRDGQLLSDESIFGNTDLPFTEAKTEVVIDRITSAAMPRQIERVPAGAEFSLEIILNIFSEDNEAELKAGLMQALKLLEDDYLGGNGSRGHGQVRFEIEKIVSRDAAYYKGESGETDLTAEMQLHNSSL